MAERKLTHRVVGSIETRVLPLKDKLENALNESRILMLGVQVLIGFDYRAVFEDKFSSLSPLMQGYKLVSLELQLIALALLLAPIPYHWVMGRGENPRALHGYSQKVIECALVPFGLAMALDILVTASLVISVAASYVLGGAVLVLATFFWFGLEYFQREKQGMQKRHETAEESGLQLKDKIKEVLIETRVALPGVQATLGFQFIIVLATSFDALPYELRIVHLISLLCSAVCAVLLIAPAAYHRIVLGGEDSQEFLHFASVMLLTALVPLALALSGDVVVVVWKVTQSMELAVFLAVMSLLATLGFWFGYMYWRRGRAA